MGNWFDGKNMSKGSAVKGYNQSVKQSTELVKAGVGLAVVGAVLRVI